MTGTITLRDSPYDPLADIAPHVADSGEGRWTVIDAVEQGIAAPVLTLALQMRFASQDTDGYAYRLLALMRNAFGGHAIKSAQAMPAVQRPDGA